MKQVAGIQRNTLLHRHFTLTCNSTTIRRIPPAIKKLNLLAVGSSWWWSSYTTNWSGEVHVTDVHCVEFQQLILFLFSLPLLRTVFFLITKLQHCSKVSKFMHQRRKGIGWLLKYFHILLCIRANKNIALSSCDSKSPEAGNLIPTSLYTRGKRFYF